MGDVIVVISSEFLSYLSEFGIECWDRPEWPPSKEWLKELREKRKGKGYLALPLWGHGKKGVTLLDFLDRHLSYMCWDDKLRRVDGILRIDYEYTDRQGNKGITILEKVEEKSG